MGLRMLKPTLLTRMSRESPSARRVGDEGGALGGIGHVARGAGDAEAAGAPLGDRGVDVGGRARAGVHGRAVGRKGLDDGAAGGGGGRRWELGRQRRGAFAGGGEEIEDGRGSCETRGRGRVDAPETFRAAGHDGGLAVESEGGGRGAHLARAEG